jgi:hypothetical protein
MQMESRGTRFASICARPNIEIGVFFISEMPGC